MMILVGDSTQLRQALNENSIYDYVDVYFENGCDECTELIDPCPPPEPEYEIVAAVPCCGGTAINVEINTLIEIQEGDGVVVGETCYFLDTNLSSQSPSFGTFDDVIPFLCDNEVCDCGDDVEPEELPVTIQLSDCCTGTIGEIINIPADQLLDVSENGRVYIINGCALAFRGQLPLGQYELRENWDFANCKAARVFGGYKCSIWELALGSCCDESGGIFGNINVVIPCGPLGIDGLEENWPYNDYSTYLYDFGDGQYCYSIENVSFVDSVGPPEYDEVISSVSQFSEDCPSCNELVPCPTQTQTQTPTLTQTPTQTVSNTPTKFTQVWRLKQCCDPDSSLIDVNIGYGFDNIPQQGQSFIYNFRCYYLDTPLQVQDNSVDIIWNNITHYDDCDECKQENNQNCKTRKIVSCQTGLVYVIVSSQNSVSANLLQFSNGIEQQYYFIDLYSISLNEGDDWFGQETLNQLDSFCFYPVPDSTQADVIIPLDETPIDSTFYSLYVTNVESCQSSLCNAPTQTASFTPTKTPTHRLKHLPKLKHLHKHRHKLELKHLHKHLQLQTHKHLLRHRHQPKHKLQPILQHLPSHPHQVVH